MENMIFKLKKTARLAGLLYLILVIKGVFSINLEVIQEFPNSQMSVEI